MSRLALVAVVGLFGCKAAETDTSAPAETGETGVTGETGETDTAQTIEVSGASSIWDDCGPADGPALRMVLDGNRGTIPCDDGGVHLVALYLFASLPTTAPATLTVGSDYSAGGSATYCPDYTVESCLNAASGTVEFTTYTHDSAAAGTFTFTLADGTIVTGPFDASWCANSPLCG